MAFACTASEDPDDASVALPDPCTLISAAEIESLLGIPIEGELQDATTAGGDVRRCSWRRKYSPQLRIDTVVLSVAAATAYAADGSTELIGSSPHDIGDEGQLLDQSRGVQIAWKKGELSAIYRYALQGELTDDFEPLRTRAKELAHAADDRM